MNEPSDDATRTEGTRQGDVEGFAVRRYGRVVYSRGPIIRFLEILSALSGLVAVAALIYTVTALSSRVSIAQFAAAQATVHAQAAQIHALRAELSSRSAHAEIRAVQRARFRAAMDNCLLLRGLVFAAATPQTANEAKGYINSTKLRNCYAYGRSIEYRP